MTTLRGMRQQAIVADLINRIAARGGWCGETHIQKSTFFLLNVTKVPLEYEYVLYKYGPYSFELHDDLVAMKARGFVSTSPQRPYGPSFRVGELGQVLLQRFQKTLRTYELDLEFIAEELSDMNVVEFEPLATALYVYVEHEDDSVEERARLVHELKPHVPIESARSSVIETAQIIERSPNRRRGGIR